MEGEICVTTSLDVDVGTASTRDKLVTDKKVRHHTCHATPKQRDTLFYRTGLLERQLPDLLRIERQLSGINPV
jgi:hypothetical protein